VKKGENEEKYLTKYRTQVRSQSGVGLSVVKNQQNQRL